MANGTNKRGLDTMVIRTPEGEELCRYLAQCRTDAVLDCAVRVSVALLHQFVNRLGLERARHSAGAPTEPVRPSSDDGASGDTINTPDPPPQLRLKFA